MRLTRSAAQALHALAFLAEQDEGSLVDAQTIALACGIPHLSLLKALHALASAGVLRSVQGLGGGYRLARPAAKITMLEVVQAVDGPVDGRNPLAPDGAHPLDRRLEQACERSAGAVRGLLGSVRLSDLAAVG
jgi:Rrf2 family protein